MNAAHQHDHDELSAHHRGDSSYTHRARAAGGRTLSIAVALTLGFAFVELIGGLWSGSLALLADAGHMATDSASLLFALIANIIARRPISETPFLRAGASRSHRCVRQRAVHGGGRSVDRDRGV